MADTVITLEITNGAPPLSADADLIDGLRAGTEESFERLIALYQHPVYNLVFRLLSDPADACDVTQEVFLKVFRNIPAFKAQSSLKTWIYRIALNEAHNRQRWFGRHRKHEVGLDRDEDENHTFEEIFADQRQSPFDFTLGVETQALIQDALGRLNLSFRDAVILRDIEELSYEEIAEILQISLGTVKSRIMRGREALRKELLGKLARGEAAPASVGVPVVAARSSHEFAAGD